LNHLNFFVEGLEVNKWEFIYMLKEYPNWC